MNSKFIFHSLTANLIIVFFVEFIIQLQSIKVLPKREPLQYKSAKKDSLVRYKLKINKNSVIVRHELFILSSIFAFQSSQKNSPQNLLRNAALKCFPLLVEGLVRQVLICLLIFATIFSLKKSKIWRHSSATVKNFNAAERKKSGENS